MFVKGLNRVWRQISKSLHQADSNNIVITNLPSNPLRGFWFNVKDKEYTLDIKQGQAPDEEKPYIRFWRNGALKGSIYQQGGGLGIDITGGMNASSIAISTYIMCTKLAWGSASGDAGFNRESAGRLCLYDANTLTNYRDLKLRNIIGVGALSTGIAAKTADYTSTANDGTLSFDASGASRTCTLETAVGAAGRIHTITKSDSSSNTVTIVANGAELIGTASSIILSAQGDGITLQSNGVGWTKISSPQAASSGSSSASVPGSLLIANSIQFGGF